MFNKKELRSFIMKESDVTTMLKVINKHINDKYSIGECGWKDQDRWFIHFWASKKDYERIVIDLLKVGKFSVEVRPGGQIDVLFEKA